MDLVVDHSMVWGLVDFNFKIAVVVGSNQL